MKRLGAAILAAVLLQALPANATTLPRPSAGDPRLRVVEYSPDQVVLLTATLGYSITIEFGADERVETVSIGDSLGWQVTPNRRASLLFLKPIDRAAPTNMAVVTNLRTYNFELRVRSKARGDDRSLIYGLKFEVPEPVRVLPSPPPSTEPKAPEPPRVANAAYSYGGARTGLPVRVFDDGHSTYFTFGSNADYPAIFAVDPDKKEVTVNVAQQGEFLVIDRLAQEFVLRRGDQVTRIFNDGYAPDDGQGTTLPPRKER